MKNITKTSVTLSFSRIFYTAFMAFAASLISLAAWAQDVPEKVDVDIEADTGSVWYGQPWVWAVGVALFIIIIVAITRSGTRRDV